jgi:type II secretory pathway component PulF
VILLIFVLIFIVIMVFVVPGLVKVLTSSRPSVSVYYANNNAILFFVNQWYLAVAVVENRSILYYYPRTKEGKDVFDALILKLRFWQFFLESYIARLQKIINLILPVFDY